MIESQISVLQQANQYLELVSTEQYQAIIQPYFISSAGAHMRHILDHYFAIQNGLRTGIIDYDYRNRQSDIEQQPAAAHQAITELMAWLQQIPVIEMEQVLELSTEISITQQQLAIVPTTLARELVFTSSHAVHHFAMIAQIALHQHLHLPRNFGVAPATASYLRQQAQMS